MFGHAASIGILNVHPLSTRVPLLGSRSIGKRRGIYWIHWQLHANEVSYPDQAAAASIF